MKNKDENKREEKSRNFGECLDKIKKKTISDKESLFFYLPLKLNELSINDLEKNKNAE